MPLPDEVVRHIQVLRMQIDNEITLFNGNGNGYLAIILEIGRKAIQVKISQCIPNANEAKLRLDLALCLIANDKMDLAIQKATELGVKSITPVISERSQRLSSEKIEKRLEHWRKTIISSCEQCGQNSIPQITSPCKLSDVVANSSHSLKFILSPHDKTMLTNGESHKQAILLVGPEGGFSPNEVQNAIQHSFTPLKLGDLILRTETAVISGISYINFKFGTWI